MRAKLITLLRYLLRLLEHRLEDAFITRVRELVSHAHGFAPGTSGQYKRDYVYSRLLKEFPEKVKAEIGLAIELVVNNKDIDNA